MGDWVPGDLALCVRGGPITGGDAAPVAGRKYQVISTRIMLWTDCTTSLGLILAGAPLNKTGIPIWWHERFVKITPGHQIEGSEVDQRNPWKVGQDA